MDLLNIQTIEELKKSHTGWIEEALSSNGHVRESKWVQSVAVGSKKFVEMTKKKLGFRVKGRSVSRSDEDYQLREQQVAYNAHFAPENAPLSDDNTYYWNISDVI
jgi:hypothetical protein